MEKNREIFNRSSSFNCYKVSCKEPVTRQGRSGLGRGDPSAGGFSWPPIRSYSCSFCKREFRSAQALGGHMNVHRRDRARLRHYSPPWNLSPSNPNPNLISSNCVPNLNMPPPSDPTCPGFISPAATLSCSSSSVSLAETVGLRGWRNFMDEGGRKDRNPIRHEAGDLVHLDLDMGMSFGDFDDSLDLELRLGCT